MASATVAVVTAAEASLLLVVGDSVLGLVVLSIITVGVLVVDCGETSVSKRLGHRWQGNNPLRAAARASG